jgi:hypothetical protein
MVSRYNYFEIEFYGLTWVFKGLEPKSRKALSAKSNLKVTKVCSDMLPLRVSWVALCSDMLNCRAWCASEFIFFPPPFSCWIVQRLSIPRLPLSHPASQPLSRPPKLQAASRPIFPLGLMQNPQEPAKSDLASGNSEM